MIKIQFSDIRILAVIIVLLTGFDFLIATILIGPSEFSSFSVPILLILLALALVMLALAFKIWKIILTYESKVKVRYKNILVVAAIFTLTAGFISLIIYIAEITLVSSGFLSLDLTSSQDEIGYAFTLMILTYQLKYIHNILGLLGILLTGIIWTLQFRKWARFSQTPFIRSFYLVGVTMIILFMDQIATNTLQYFLYWIYPGEDIDVYPPAIQAIIMILLLIATVVLGIYLYFLAVAGQNLHIPQDEEQPKSRKAIILPLIFLILWFLTTLMKFEEGRSIFNSIINLLGIFFLVAAFAPISLGFFSHSRTVASKFLRNNLFLAAIGTLALATFSIVGPSQWTGLSVLTGYLLAFSILTWSLANISQFLGSREALLRRLKEAGAQFLTEIGEADMKEQSYHQMAKFMADVSIKFMKDLTKVNSRIPPTEEEIRKYIVSIMGISETPSEREIIDYLKKAIQVIYPQSDKDIKYRSVDGTIQ